jgi:hypothetical protein
VGSGRGSCDGGSGGSEHPFLAVVCLGGFRTRKRRSEAFAGAATEEDDGSCPGRAPRALMLTGPEAGRWMGSEQRPATWSASWAPADPQPQPCANAYAFVEAQRRGGDRGWRGKAVRSRSAVRRRSAARTNPIASLPTLTSVSP